MICQTCFRHCQLEEGQIGFCRARKNQSGQIVCCNYGYLTAMAIDPIEKKPLAMFHPGSTILSIGSYGCNLDCPFCQNYTISRQDNEMLCSWEYIRDCAKLIHEAGMLNVLVTNGTASQMVLDAILPYMDAINIDLKSFDAKTYDSILHGNLEQTMAFIERAVQSCHIEITTLVVPGMNDRESEIDAMTQWIASLNPDIPYHLTRYFPRYHMDTPATNISTLYRLKDIAKTHLHHVFLGNV